MRAEPPEPGTPEGCDGFVRRGQWFGWKKESAVTVHRVSVWLSQAHRDRGDKPMELLIADGRILSTKRASKCVPGPLLKMLQDKQCDGQGSRQICDAIRDGGGIVDAPPKVGETYQTEEYKTKQGKPPMWRNVWQASQHLATLIHDPATEGYLGYLTRGDVTTTLEYQLRAIGPKVYSLRWGWLKTLTCSQREDLAWAVRAAGNAIVQEPPHWQWWTGKTGSRHFLQVNEHSCTVSVRPIISYKAGPSCLRTLILRWIGPCTEFVKQSGIERQRQLFQETA